MGVVPRSSVSKIAAVIPCLNEAGSVARVVREALEGLAATGLRGEVVVADNQSSDDSAAIASMAGARVVSVEPRGYGTAVMAGVAASEADMIVMGDADGSYDFREIPSFLNAITAGADLVVGCRFPSGGGRIERGAMPVLNRFVGNPLFTALARSLFGLRTRDIHSGMRGFTRAFITRLDLRCPGMEFASEMLLRAHRRRARIVDIPIVLRRDGRRGAGSHLHPFRDGIRHLRLFARIPMEK